MPQVFAGRYQVILELGRGGMGRVLRARDLKLGWLRDGEMCDTAIDEPTARFAAGARDLPRRLADRVQRRLRALLGC